MWRKLGMLACLMLVITFATPGKAQVLGRYYIELVGRNSCTTSTGRLLAKNCTYTGVGFSVLYSSSPVTMWELAFGTLGWTITNVGRTSLCNNTSHLGWPSDCNNRTVGFGFPTANQHWALEQNATTKLYKIRSMNRKTCSTRYLGVNATCSAFGLGLFSGTIPGVALTWRLVSVNPPPPSPRPPPPPSLAPAPGFVPFSDPIARHFKEIGGSNVTGAVVGARFPPLSASNPAVWQYQAYTKGTIFYDPSLGAAWIFPPTVAAVWLANRARLGPPLSDSVHYPTPGSTTCATKKSLSGTVSYFAEGGIVYQEQGGYASIMAGSVWVKHREMSDVFGPLGPITPIPPSPPPSPPSIPCLTEDNVNYWGGDILPLSSNGLPASGPDGCCQRCRQVVGCKHWSFAKSTGACWIKDTWTKGTRTCTPNPGESFPTCTPWSNLISDTNVISGLADQCSSRPRPYVSDGECQSAPARRLQAASAGSGRRLQAALDSYRGGGASATSFACGWLVEETASVQPHAVYALLEGHAITTAHQGGLYLKVGDPVGDEEMVVTRPSNSLVGDTVGSLQRFKKGVIFRGNKAGVVAVSSATQIPGRQPLLCDYETNHDGPLGALGFPVAGIKAVSVATPGGGPTTVYALDCENGVLVMYPTLSGDNVLPYWGKTLPFTYLQLYVGDLKTYGDDTATNNNQDPFFAILLEVRQTGQVNQTSVPTSGHYNEAPVVEIQKVLFTVPKLQSFYTVRVRFQATDYDSTGANDELGVLDKTVDMSTAWGRYRKFDEFAASPGLFQPEYSFKIYPAPLHKEFRYNYMWPFGNPSTSRLNTDQMADTFSDIGRDENVIMHPFHALYFDNYYKHVASGGNCFGMSLSATYAQKDLSAFQPPLANYGTQSASAGHDHCICIQCNFPDNVYGICGPDNVAANNRPILLEVNKFQGYQQTLFYFYATMNRNLDIWRNNYRLNDAVQVFNAAEAGHNAGDLQMLSLKGEDSGHAIRAYGYRRNADDPECMTVGSSRCHVILVADPNFPYDGDNATADAYKILVNPNNGRWTHNKDSRFNNQPEAFVLSNVPFSWLSSRSASLAANLPGVGGLMVYKFFMAGDGTQSVVQVTDQAGRNTFNPALPVGVDTQSLWLPGPPGEDGPFVLPSPQVLVGSRFSGTAKPVRIAVKPSANTVLAFGSPDGTLDAHLPRGNGSSDILYLNNMDWTPTPQGFSLKLGSKKVVRLRLAQPTGIQQPLVWDITNLLLEAGEALSVSLYDGGQALKIGSLLNGKPKSVTFDLKITRGLSPFAMRNAITFSRFTADGGKFLVPTRLPPLKVVGPPHR